MSFCQNSSRQNEAARGKGCKQDCQGLGETRQLVANTIYYLIPFLLYHYIVDVSYMTYFLALQSYATTYVIFQVPGHTNLQS